MPVAIQTVPNKGSQTIQTVPNKDSSSTIWTTSIKTKTLTKTLPNSSTITEIVLETAKVPVEPIDVSQSQNSVALWFSKNEKMAIGVSCGILFLIIIASIVFQIKYNKAKKRAEAERVIVSPKTPKTPETPDGLRERRRIRDEISRRTEGFFNYDR
jgi:hypothetical protein